MKHAGYDRLFIHLQVRQYDGYPQRMHDIRLPGLAALPSMGFFRKLVCFFNHRNIRRRVIPSDAGN